jgi:hypothetical protein
MDEISTLLTHTLAGAGSLRPLAGATWLPESLLAQLAPALPGPARRLARVACDAGLDFAFVPAEAPWAIDAARCLADEGLAIVWAVPGPLWPVLSRRGTARAIATTSRDPDALADAMREELERVQSDVETGLALDVAAVVIAEDLASHQGFLVAPDFAIMHAVPALARAASTIVDAGKAAVFHSDGDVRPVLDAVLETGFTALHTGAVDPDRGVLLASEAIRRGLTLVGGLPGVLLERGGAPAARAAAELVAAERAGVRVVADDGGLVTAAGFRTLARLATFVRGRAALSSAEPRRAPG